MHYFHQQPLKPGIGQYSSTSTADADETPFLEMCIGRFRSDTYSRIMTKYAPCDQRLLILITG